MKRFTPPLRRRTVPVRVQKVISYVWIITALALPLAGVAAITQMPALMAEPDTAPTYEVRYGDTLSQIALRYGVTLDALVQANGLTNPDAIFVGQVLVIPQEEATAGQQVYTVQTGDTLAMIARRYDLSVEEIMSANNLESINSIFTGQRLLIPGAGGDLSVEADASYTVQRGDSLYRVSLIFGVPVDDLLAANHLSSPNAIYPGLVLRVPPPGSVGVNTGAAEGAGEEQTGGQTYLVQRGDTLGNIAIRYEVTVDGLVAANGLSGPDRIYPGQLLNIPEPGAAARPYPAQTAVSHRVVAGETLGEIALRYGVTVHALAYANGIDNPARIIAGTVLSIPSAQTASNSVRYASVGSGLCEDVDVERSGTGYFARPVRGYTLTQRFHSGHPGIDLAIDEGTSVYAADGGTVVYSGWNSAGYGNLVVLDHGNGWRTYYAHLSAVYVGCGEWIPRGSIIGEVGSTGNSTGPHLHFEMLRFGIAVNPEGYLRY
jgi:murein DD-endopeptidase MepM/ murein hydrolase activator NlpD